MKVWGKIVFKMHIDLDLQNKCKVSDSISQNSTKETHVYTHIHRDSVGLEDIMEVGLATLVKFSIFRANQQKRQAAGKATGYMLMLSFIGRILWKPNSAKASS